MKPLATKLPFFASLLLLFLATPSAEAQCVQEESGIIVELVLKGENFSNFSYTWAIEYGGSTDRVEQVYFQLESDVAGFEAPQVTPNKPASTVWNTSATTFPGSLQPALNFSFVSGYSLFTPSGESTNRMFMFSYATPEVIPPIRVRVETYDPSDNLVNVFDDIFTTIGCGILPVELARFDALIDDGAADLVWETSTERNNAGFEVQYAAKGGVFETLAFVEGAGTTIEEQRYAFRTDDLEPGTHSFRLKQVDFDGAFAYSDVIEIEIAAVDGPKLTVVGANPFRALTSARLTLARDEVVRVEVYNAMGQRVAVLADGFLAADEQHSFSFDAGSLPSGLYILRATGETFAETQRLTLVK